MRTNQIMPGDFETMDGRAERVATSFWSGVVLSTLLGLGTIFAVTAPAFGHKLPCGHIDNSPAKGYNKCSPKVATCTTSKGNPGNCKQMRTFSNTWCECVPSAKPSGGCGSVALYFLSDQGEPPPAANDTIIYLAASHAENFVSVALGSLAWPIFGPEDNGMEGTIDLKFGSFADPAAVPVTVEDISMSSPSVFLSGTNFFSLPGAFPLLVYDSTTGFLDTVDSTGIQIEVTNDHGAEVVTAHLTGETVPGGFQLNVQLYSENPLFADGFESGDLSRWSSLGAAAVDFIDSLGRRMGWARPVRRAASPAPVGQAVCSSDSPSNETFATALMP